MESVKNNKVTRRGVWLLYIKSPVELYSCAIQLVRCLLGFLDDTETIESVLFEDEVMKSIEYFVKIKESNLLFYSWFESTCDLAELLYKCHQTLHNQTSDYLSYDDKPLKEAIENSHKSLWDYNFENLEIAQNIWTRSYRKQMIKLLRTQNSRDCSITPLSLKRRTVG